MTTQNESFFKIKNVMIGKAQSILAARLMFCQKDEMPTLIGNEVVFPKSLHMAYLNGLESFSLSAFD